MDQGDFGLLTILFTVTFISIVLNGAGYVLVVLWATVGLIALGMTVLYNRVVTSRFRIVQVSRIADDTLSENER